MDDKGRGHPFMTSTRSGKGGGEVMKKGLKMRTDVDAKREGGLS